MLPKAKSTKLTKCFFSTVFSEKDTPYGIYNDQIRAHGIINSAGWFNSEGDRLGKGDLSLNDMATISRHIYPDQLFIVLSENSSFIDFPSGLDYLAPGIDYVFRNAAWVIGSGGVIIRVREETPKVMEAEQDGVKYVRMGKNEFFKGLKLSSKKEPKPIAPPKPVPALKAQPVVMAKPILIQQPMLGMPPLPPPLANTSPKLPGLFPAPLKTNPILKAKPLPPKKVVVKKTSNP